MIRVARANLVFIAILCLTAGVASGIILAKPLDTTIQLPPCATEDSGDCYWQADQSGNQIGASFVVIDGITYSPNVVSE